MNDFLSTHFTSNSSITSVSLISCNIFYKLYIWKEGNKVWGQAGFPKTNNYCLVLFNVPSQYKTLELIHKIFKSLKTHKSKTCE